MRPERRTTGVLVAGAGPVGLTIAIELARRGVDCRIIDRRSEPRPGTRACTVWQRTLEVFRLMGLPVDAYRRAGSRYVHRTYHIAGHPPFTHDMSVAASPCPNALIIGQRQTEDMLTAHLAGLGVTVERGQEVVRVWEGDTGVRVELARPDGTRCGMDAEWLVAADGPHSAVRDALGIGWRGTPYPGTQLIQIDARIRGSLPGDPAHCHMFLAHAGSLGTAPLPGGRVRLYAGVADPDPGMTRAPRPGEMEAAIEAIAGARVRLRDPRYAWRVRLHNTVADTFASRRCLLAGDSAHTVMPVTAQGMNTGIQDAFNLGWKLAQVVLGQAPPRVLHSYEPERRPVALALVKRTERAYWGGTGPLPDFDRLYEGLHRIGTTHTGLPIAYPDSPISREADGSAPPRAGDRAPDGLVRSAGGTNGRLYDRFGTGEWTLLEFPGSASPDARRIGGARLAELLADRPRVRTFCLAERPDDGASAENSLIPTRALLDRYCGRQGGLFLVRPDGHLGFRGQAGDFAALGAYLAEVTR